MTTIRKFTCRDTLKYSNVNLDYYTETFHFPFYFEYLTKWTSMCYLAKDLNGRMEGFIIPTSLKTINGKPTVEMTSLTIPSQVTSIGNDCFDECTSLKSITIPSTVKAIGNNCFNNCTNIKMMSIPSTISKLNSTWFYSCKELTKLDLPHTINSFPAKMFANFSKLKQFTIPSNVTCLPESCFFNL